jgi:hypothetical protein
MVTQLLRTWLQLSTWIRWFASAVFFVLWDYWTEMPWFNNLPYRQTSWPIQGLIFALGMMNLSSWMCMTSTQSR